MQNLSGYIAPPYRIFSRLVRLRCGVAHPGIPRLSAAQTEALNVTSRTQRPNRYLLSCAAGLAQGNKAISARHAVADRSYAPNPTASVRRPIADYESAAPYGEALRISITATIRTEEPIALRAAVGPITLPNGGVYPHANW